MISRNDTIEAPIAKLNQPPILAEIVGIEIKLCNTFLIKGTCKSLVLYQW